MSRIELRKFGLLIGNIFLLLGGWMCWKGFFLGVFLLGAGILLVTLGIALPSWLAPVYWLWMKLAWLLGEVMSRVILCGVFYGVITPIAFLLRFTRKDLLELNSDPRETTYWKKKDPHPPSEHLERQY